LAGLRRRKIALKTRRDRRGSAPRRSPLAACLVALSLFVQLFASATPPALAAPAFASADDAAIAAELRAVFGATAELCLHVNDESAPRKHAPSGHCCDQCPLCRCGAQAAAFVSPDAPAAPQRLDAGRHAIGAAPDFGAFPASPARTNLARAPPLAV
jgi:hypothetical protein